MYMYASAGVSLPFLAGLLLLYCFHRQTKHFELNFVKLFKLSSRFSILELGGQNHPHSQSICPSLIESPTSMYGTSGVT